MQQPASDIRGRTRKKRCATYVRFSVFFGFWLWQNKLLSGKLIGAYIAINKYINKHSDTRKKERAFATHSLLSLSRKSSETKRNGGYKKKEHRNINVKETNHKFSDRFHLNLTIYYAMAGEENCCKTFRHSDKSRCLPFHYLFISFLLLRI